MTRRAIPDQLSTVPQLLREVGYRTVGVSPNANLSSATGLNRGFDEFIWLDKSELIENVGVRTVAKFLLNLRRHGGGITTDTRKHNTGYMMTDAAKRWLRHNGRRNPFFMYLHYGDPHHPYYPPLPLLRREARQLGVDPKDAGELALKHHADLDEHVARGLPYSDHEWEILTGLYDAGIEYVDGLVGTLLKYLESRDVGDTIVVVTADHGELFGEQGLLGHKVTVHDALAHVPLVVYGLDEAINYDGDLVQHIDVMQTLLDVVGADTDQFQGINLGEEKRTQAIIQRGADRYQKHLNRYEEYNPGFDTSRFHHGQLTAVRTNEFKYLKSANRTELFVLPDEKTDVSDQYPEIAAMLDERVTDWLDTAGRPFDPDAEDRELSEAARKQLSELGYIVE